MMERTGVGDLLAAHKKNGVVAGLVSCLDSIFFNDPAEGDERLAPALPDGYLLAVSHNPELPFARREAEENRLRASAVRLFPGYHGYSLADALCVEFCRAAAQSGMVIQIVAKMDDVRLDYLWRQNPPDAEAAAELAKTLPSAKFILSGHTASAICNNAASLSECDNLYIDLSYSGDLVFAYDRACAAIPRERLLFGTFSPILCAESSRMALETAGISDETRRLLAYGNAARLFGLVSPPPPIP
jgi:predicted TIM-barrel fold metal-dependent hydrolase